MIRQLWSRTPAGARHLAKRFLPETLWRALGDRARLLDVNALHKFRARLPEDVQVDRSLDKGIAVVVPCYNHARYLEATLQSLTQQTFRPFQVIFVDDCSPDNSYEVLEKFCRQAPPGLHPVLLRTPRNSGQAYAINYALEQTDASVYTILNDDDYLMHDALEAIVAILRSRRHLYLIGATSRILSGHGAPNSDLFIREMQANYAAIPLVEYAPDDILALRNVSGLNMTHTGTSFFKSAWQVVGGYYASKAKRVVVYSDGDFQLRVASVFPVAVSSTIPFCFWRSDSSVDEGIFS